MSVENKINEKDLLDLLWNYFQQHAQQRIGLFNFFVVFSVLTTTGLLTTFQEKYDAHYIGIAIGLCLSLISFIFWKIDERNKFLTKNGEKAIIEFEKSYDFGFNRENLNILRVFSNEKTCTNNLRKKEMKKCFVHCQFSLSKSFNIIFLTFFVIGVIGVFASAWFQLNQQNNHKENSCNLLHYNAVMYQNIKITDEIKSIDNICQQCQKLYINNESIKKK